MNKITITHLVDFSRKTPRGRQTLVNNLKTPKVKTATEDGGGDYWISALSCISRVFTDNTGNSIGDKIDELIDKIEVHEAKITKDMHQRNINILQGFEDFDFDTLRPPTELTYLKKPKEKSIVAIKRLPLYAKPNHVFTFNDNGKRKIGAIWFVAKLNGFAHEELTMVTELLYRYLDMNYSDKYEIANEYCITMDVNSVNSISYAQLGNKKVKSSLLQTVDEIKKLI